MLSQLRPTLAVLGALTLVTGVIYPVLVTAAAKGVFAKQASGSLLEQNGHVVGSSLIGQPFDDPRYFWSRPSATGPSAYNASSSSGSNLGPSNPALLDAIKGRVQALRAADPGNTDAIPVDLVTASGSGLDPDLSPAAAAYQAARVARVRHLDEGRVRRLVEEHTAKPDLGLLGDARVNVLRLNVALDELQIGEAHEDGRASRP
jgi:K+-transporting ATPase ATPase C chain